MQRIWDNFDTFLVRVCWLLAILFFVSLLPPFVKSFSFARSGQEPYVVELKITPTLGFDNDLSDGWRGYNLYDIAEFKVEAIWSDGKPDPNCTRTGKPPEWTCSFGWFEGEKQGLDKVTMAVPGTRIAVAKERPQKAVGAKVLWCTGHTPTRWGEPVIGTITVSYADKVETIRVIADNPDRDFERRWGRWGLTVTNIPMAEREQGDIIRQYFFGGKDFVLSFRTEEYFNRKRERVREISRSLHRYIRDWLDGKVPAQIPSSVLLDEPGLVRLTNACDGWTLVKPEEVSPEEQWLVRPAMEIPEDFSELYYMGPDPHCTYLVTFFIAPFGAKLIVEGEFPHCRFMNFQISPPFDPRFPAFGGAGVMEVPIVDADIEPEPGSVNPFRVGANRMAKNRRYRLEFILTEGDAVLLNEKVSPKSMTPIAFRSKSNVRVGGPFVETGVWGKGAIVPAMLWVRYYAPDKKAGPLGGVPLPKLYLQLPTGEKFWIKHDLRLTKRYSNVPIPAKERAYEDYQPFNSRLGWMKIFGGFLMYAEAFGMHLAANPLLSAILGGEKGIKERVREMDKDFWGRGPNEPPPGCYSTGSTFCVYINYLGRLMSLPIGKVLVITGKLPKAPKTLDGQKKMTGGEARYWSLTRYGASPFELTSLGLCYDSIMDEEIITNRDGWYVIVFSSPEDRPYNAKPENGVTWRNWGPDRGKQSLIIRWLTVVPEWHDPKHSPDDKNVSWLKGAWSSAEYEQSLIGFNRRGIMGDYHPVLHLMTKKEFEALGDKIDPRNIVHSENW
ncbi:MAG: hypothetical protein NZ805_08365 [Armatimonadetes bacterium]|nr:hypothetical protein [Armatimonadota bacterium]MDW8027973.1 hypothetical protein [Armatimonadota bacterium]